MNVAVFGFGAVGRDLSSSLVKRGDAVRIVQRHAPPVLAAGCTFHAADVLDRAATLEACAGVDTVVCCIGFAYDCAAWRRAWPLAMQNLLEACAANGARFVFADNLYMYGPQTAPLTEDMPLTGYGCKPALRSAITRLWLEAHAAGRVKAVAVRAPDFYGPLCATSVIAEFGAARLLAGKPALVPYPANEPHDFAYVPDFARALVSLVDAPDDAYGQAWHVPCAPAKSLREVLALAAERIGVPLRITAIPRAIAPVVGLFVKEVREIQEMLFQWDRPYLVDATKFSARFWSDPTSLEDGLDATIASYRQRA